jgi:ABC-type phosphate/phosphonate transport system substrate-binding protein
MFYKQICCIGFLLFLSHTVSAQELQFAVNEGVTYQDDGLPSERFKLLIKMLSKELKRPIKLHSISHYSDFEHELAAEHIDLAFIHPANVGLTAAKSGNYVGLASAKDFTDYRARIMVKADSPLKSLADLKGKKIGVPSLESITTVMFIASLREIGIADPAKQFSPTRYQDAVPVMLDYGYVDAGVTGSGTVAKSWIAKGGRVIAETKPVPIKQFLISRRFSAEERERVQNLLLKLNDNDDGKAALVGLHINGFVPWNTAMMDEASKRLGL